MRNANTVHSHLARDAGLFRADDAESEGELQAELYEGLRTVRQPVRLVVGRPW